MSMEVWFYLSYHITFTLRKRSGSVVECLTRARGPGARASPGSLGCVLEQDALILA